MKKEAAQLAAWAGVAQRTLATGTCPRLSDARNWPPATGDWKDALALLAGAQHGLIGEVRKLSDSSLERPVPPENKSTVYVLLHGVVQHNLYHAGQIALLKKG